VTVTLFEKLAGNNEAGKLRWAAVSACNFLKAVRLILEKNGYPSDLSKFQKPWLGNYTGYGKKISLSNEQQIQLFESLYSSAVFQRQLELLKGKSVVLNGAALIIFYYAMYNLVHAVFLLQEVQIPANHQSSIKQFEQIRNILPLPFNARFFVECWKSDSVEGEMKPPELRNQGAGDELRKVKITSAERAIEQYFEGTATWYCETKLRSNIYEDLRKKGLLSTNGKIQSNEARQIRDEFYKSKCNANFLQCLYRLRGKVNYRDPIFLTYSKCFDEDALKKLVCMVEDMEFIARALRYVVQSLAKVRLQDDTFIESIEADTQANLRGI
jgi:hypothetical protein